MEQFIRDHQFLIGFIAGFVIIFILIVLYFQWQDWKPIYAFQTESSTLHNSVEFKTYTCRTIYYSIALDKFKGKQQSSSEPVDKGYFEQIEILAHLRRGNYPPHVRDFIDRRYGKSPR